MSRKFHVRKRQMFVPALAGAFAAGAILPLQAEAATLPAGPATGELVTTGTFSQPAHAARFKLASNGSEGSEGSESNEGSEGSESNEGSEGSESSYQAG